MPKMNLISGELPDLRLKSDSHLSPEEQKFLAEETTNRQVVQDQASAAAMVESGRRLKLRNGQRFGNSGG